MKGFKFSTILFTLYVLSSCTATMTGAKASAEMRSMQKVVEIPGLTQDEIYIRANSWFVSTFNSAESVIEFQDKESGKIMGKYVFTYGEGVYTFGVKQTVDVEMKEGKMRVSFTNPNYRTLSGMGETYYNTQYTPLETEAGVKRARAEWEQLVIDLTEYINNESSDW